MDLDILQYLSPGWKMSIPSGIIESIVDDTLNVWHCQNEKDCPLSLSIYPRTRMRQFSLTTQYIHLKLSGNTLVYSNYMLHSWLTEMIFFVFKWIFFNNYFALFCGQIKYWVQFHQFTYGHMELLVSVWLIMLLLFFPPIHSTIMPSITN